MNWMIKLINFLFKLFRKDVHVRDVLWIYFPNVKRFYDMEVSSIRKDEITARFRHFGDYNDSNVAEDYNQLDNDIVISKLDWLPKKVGK